MAQKSDDHQVPDDINVVALRGGGAPIALEEGLGGVLDLPEEAEPVPVRHPGRWVATACLLVLAAMFIHSLVYNPNYQWSVIEHYFFRSLILQGVLLTIELTVIGMGIAVVVGIICAVMRLSPNRLLSGASIGYIWFFRACPLMVQLIFWYNLTALYPHLGLGIPFGPQFMTFSANNVISPMTAAILGLSLYEGAYMAEIVRGGILAVDAGQTEAAQALGMSHLSTLRRIVLPQAMRVIIPPTGNELIGMLKNTSLVSVIALSELLFTAQSVYMRTYQVIPLLLVVVMWYLIIVTVLSIGQYYLEKRFGRGHQAAGSGGLVAYVSVLRRAFTLRHTSISTKGGGQ